MNNVECERCVKRKTMYCPNSFKCYATKDKPYWQNRIMLLEENKELHNKIDKVIEYLEDDDNFWIPDSYSEDKVKMIQKELKQILKDSDVDD